MIDKSKKDKQKIEFIFDSSIPQNERSSDTKNLDNLKNMIMDSMKEGIIISK